MRRITKILAVAVAVGWVCAAYAEEQQQYIGNEQCKMCHNKQSTGAQWDKWKSTKHSHAYETLLTDQAKAIAKKAGLTTPPAESPQCLRCHVTAYDYKDKKFNPSPLLKKEDGVQCESCHGPSSLHKKDGMMYMMHKKVDMASHRRTVTEATCLQCHNKDNPTWDPNRYTLPNGKKTGFDFKQAYAKIEHLDPLWKHHLNPFSK